MTDAESSRRARELYSKLSEEEREELLGRARESARVVCERHGLEATEETIDKIAEDVVQHFMRQVSDKLDAIVGEALTEEEAMRLMGEEFDRLDEGQGVREEVLVDATVERALREHANIFNPRSPGQIP